MRDCNYYSLGNILNQKIRIILIEGKRLAELMIDNNVGLSIDNSYLIKIIDSDYFE